MELDKRAAEDRELDPKVLLVLELSLQIIHGKGP